MDCTSRPRTVPALLALVALSFLAACASAQAAAEPAASASATPTSERRGVWLAPDATATAAIVVDFVIAQPTVGASASAPPPGVGLQATIGGFSEAIGSDPEGSKTVALGTLVSFVDPRGPYASAWWFADDGRADIYEALAVILYTEGHTNLDVRAAVAARYLWYCGGTGDACQGAALINFLSYFQPWRQPWVSRGFTSAHAAQYKDFGYDLVHQRPGLLTTLIPGADTFVHDNSSLSLGGSIAWHLTPFHFANVHSSWDSHLRQQLRRLPNGPSRLWVLTMGEASRVCNTSFICPDMTRPRN